MSKQTEENKKTFEDVANIAKSRKQEDFIKETSTDKKMK